MGVFFLAGLGLGVTGCQSSFDAGPAKTALTSITVNNQTTAQILKVTRSVFTAHGFTETVTQKSQLTFERPGTTADNIAYGSYVFNEKVNIRAVVTLTPANNGQTLVGCDAWLLKVGSDAFFDDAHKVGGMRKGPYEELMKEIQMQLKYQAMSQSSP